MRSASQGKRPASRATAGRWPSVRRCPSPRSLALEPDRPSSVNWPRSLFTLWRVQPTIAARSPWVRLARSRTPPSGSRVPPSLARRTSQAASRGDVEEVQPPRRGSSAGAGSPAIDASRASRTPPRWRSPRGIDRVAAPRSRSRRWPSRSPTGAPHRAVPKLAEDVPDAECGKDRLLARLDPRDLHLAPRSRRARHRGRPGGRLPLPDGTDANACWPPAARARPARGRRRTGSLPMPQTGRPTSMGAMVIVSNIRHITTCGADSMHGHDGHAGRAPPGRRCWAAAAAPIRPPPTAGYLVEWGSTAVLLDCGQGRDPQPPEGPRCTRPVRDRDRPHACRPLPRHRRAAIPLPWGESRRLDYSRSISPPGGGPDSTPLGGGQRA